MDTMLLTAPLIVGALYYGTIVAAQIGLKSARNLIWGKK